MEQFTPSDNMEYYNLADYTVEIVDMLWLMNKGIRKSTNQFNRCFSTKMRDEYDILVNKIPNTTVKSGTSTFAIDVKKETLQLRDMEHL